MYYLCEHPHFSGQPQSHLFNLDLALLRQAFYRLFHLAGGLVEKHDAGYMPRFDPRKGDVVHDAVNEKLPFREGDVALAAVHEELEAVKQCTKRV